MRICEGSRGVTIKVSDQGGGISDEDIDRIWKYGYVYIYLCVCVCVCVCVCKTTRNICGDVSSYGGDLGFLFPEAYVFPHEFTIDDR